MASGNRLFTRRVFLHLILAVILLAGTGMVSAHAPLGVGSNEDIASAALISSPEKSFVLYTELHASGEAQYYLFPMQEGQILYGSLQVPGPDSPVPDLVIIGPGIEPAGTVPSFIEIPAGSGAMVIPTTQPGKPAYEPFTPQPIYEVGRFNITIPKDGNYYIAIYGPAGGKYSLAPGFLEEFTAEEWLLIPVSVLAIHLWEGQSPAAIFAPMIIVLIGGLALLFLYPGLGTVRQNPVAALVFLSGLLYLGGAAMTAMQIIYTAGATGYTAGVLVTLLFIAGPFVLGLYAIRLGTRIPATEGGRAGGIKIIVVGLLGLLLWGGLILGPVLAVICGAFILMRPAAQR